jgi:hypothetical protein
MINSLPPVEHTLYGAARPDWGRWFRAPYRLLVVHTLLMLAFMLILYLDWTDFTAQPYDCIDLPYSIHQRADRLWRRPRRDAPRGPVYLGR